MQGPIRSIHPNLRDAASVVCGSHAAFCDGVAPILDGAGQMRWAVLFSQIERHDGDEVDRTNDGDWGERKIDMSLKLSLMRTSAGAMPHVSSYSTARYGHGFYWKRPEPRMQWASLCWSQALFAVASMTRRCACCHYDSASWCYCQGFPSLSTLSRETVSTVSRLLQHWVHLRADLH
jgi:hypothetical protein